jgi:hypothetical protein
VDRLECGVLHISELHDFGLMLKEVLFALQEAAFYGQERQMTPLALLIYFYFETPPTP